MSAVLALLGPILKSLFGALLEQFAITKKTNVTKEAITNDTASNNFLVVDPADLGLDTDFLV